MSRTWIVPLLNPLLVASSAVENEVGGIKVAVDSAGRFEQVQDTPKLSRLSTTFEVSCERPQWRSHEDCLKPLNRHSRKPDGLKEHKPIRMTARFTVTAPEKKRLEELLVKDKDECFPEEKTCLGSEGVPKGLASLSWSVRGSPNAEEVNASTFYVRFEFTDVRNLEAYINSRRAIWKYNCEGVEKQSRNLPNCLNCFELEIIEPIQCLERPTYYARSSGLASTVTHIGQVVQVYSNSAKDWVDAKVISIENGLVTVKYSGPGGTMVSKSGLSAHADKDLRLKQATFIPGGPFGKVSLNPSEIKELKRAHKEATKARLQGSSGKK